MNRSTLIALSAAALLNLAACSTPSSAPPPSTAAMNAPTLNQSLQAYHWDLQSAQDQSGRALPAFTALAPRAVVRLGFAGGAQPGEQRIFTKVCNGMGGSYTLDGDKISVGKLIGTMMACADGRLMQLEQAVGAQLPRAQSVQLVPDAQAPRLTLRFNDGSQWFLKGVPTDATRYGSAGETLFYEVAPELVPCNHPLMRNAQCLRVREVRYGSNGVKTSVGDWQVFSSKIDGYTHEQGLRNVLRVKRYTLQNPPADASRYAYTLDMTVETERVK